MDVFEKSQTVDPEVRAYIYSLVSAVGGQSTLDDRYAVGDDALAVLNDLLRWLRLYDEKTNRFDVKRCLAEANLVKGDLLEILAQWPEEHYVDGSGGIQDSVGSGRLKAKLALACLQLLVPLTWPMELEVEKTTVNHLRHTPYLQLAQVGYKRAVLHHEDAGILRTAIRVGLPSMAVERRERSKRDEGIIKMVLYFLRNMAMITQPQDLPSQGDENEISRSATIERFHEQDVFSLLLTIGSGAGDEFQDQDVIVLETLFHLLKGVDAKKLFLQQTELAAEETNELQNLIKKERAMLNSYNKTAPTRHNRFGTMLWVKRDDAKMSTITGQNTITNEDTMLSQMDGSKKWNKPRYRGKMTSLFNETSDFGMRVAVSERARQHLRAFVEDFLDSGFNPLFSSLRKAIEREAERAKSEGVVRMYFYLISWFLTAEAARRDSVRRDNGWHADRTNTSSLPATGENTFAYIAAVLDQETFVLLNRHMQKSFDEKNWQSLQTTLLAFTQILLTVQSMTESRDEEDQEIAENIQNRIFYEESTQERVVQVLRGYTNQGFAYLDAVTECVHVFVRMLERYSKQNVDLQIRSKRRARKKKKDKDILEGTLPINADTSIEDAEAHEEDEADAYRAVSERKFDFQRFSAKFLTQPCVDTFIALLRFYKDLSGSQLKRCHRYFYRLAFKNEMAVYLFRVDVLALFHKLIKGPNGLDGSVEGFKEWEQLIQQIFRKCIKWISRPRTESGGGEEAPWKEASVVEMLFSKLPNTVFYLQNGFERVVEKRAPRPPAELEVKGSVEEERRVGVVVSVLIEKGQGGDVGWVKKSFKAAADERVSWQYLQEAERAARASAGDGDVPAAAEEGSKQDPPTIVLSTDTQERKEALFKDKFLRLLLREAGLQRLGTPEDTEASWIFPAELTAERLRDVVSQIERTEFDPPSFEDGKNALDLIRNKSSYRRSTAAASDSDSESGSDREIEDTLFPPNQPSKRALQLDEDGNEISQPKKKRRLTRKNKTVLSEAQAAAKAEERKRKERERNSKIKSQLFVTASDDESDEEADREFFALEEERRRRMRGVIKEQLRKEAGGGVEVEGIVDEDEGEEMEMERNMVTTPRLSGSESEHNQPAFSDDEDDEGEDDLDLNNDRTTLRKAFRGIIENDGETPSTSPIALEEEGSALPLNEVSGNAAGLAKSTMKSARLDAEVDDEDEDDAPVVKLGARRGVRRAGFIVDESDSD